MEEILCFDAEKYGNWEEGEMDKRGLLELRLSTC